MKEPGLDGRRRNKDGRIRQKRKDAINGNFSNPMPEFSPRATLGYMRKKTGQVSEDDVRRAAAKMNKK